jgi:hypothetical protein
MGFKPEARRAGKVPAKKATNIMPNIMKAICSGVKANK